MRYSVKHTTWYAYTDPVPECHNLVHLAPRDTPRQTSEQFQLTVEPEPAFSSQRTDCFGNLVDYFSVEESHRGLQVTAESTVNVEPTEVDVEDSLPWEEAVKLAGGRGRELQPEVYQFSLPTPRTNSAPQLREYAEKSFAAGLPLLEAVGDLNHRIHNDFTFDARATTVHTPLTELFKLRRGVCQDFAHLLIGSLRSMGLAARYVSGYVRTTPPKGRPRLLGADASHAWGSVYCGPQGWVEIDPTNDTFVSDSHIAVGWGRDYDDVCPVQGVIVGGGKHSMGVGVDVIPLEKQTPAGSTD